MQKISIDEFIAMKGKYPLVDVRSPAEYSHAHVPGAYNVPLFSDDERAVVGTLYKQKGREQAIKQGLKYFGPKMVGIIEEAEQISRGHEAGSAHKTVLLYCWRGGMRSAGVAWLLDLYEFKVYVLEGGYKAFRNWALQQFGKNYCFNVLSGYTGSGKTMILKELEQAGHKILDLEEIANHKGSAFGGFCGAQPTQEMFENELGLRLFSLKMERALDEYIWVEDESRRIGLVNIPNDLFARMQMNRVFILTVPFEERLNYIVVGYGDIAPDQLEAAIRRIRKRLGGLETRNAINHLNEGNITECFRILLKYYDRQYDKGMAARREFYSREVNENVYLRSATDTASIIQALKGDPLFFPKFTITEVNCENVDAEYNMKALTAKNL